MSLWMKSGELGIRIFFHVFASSQQSKGLMQVISCPLFAAQLISELIRTVLIKAILLYMKSEQKQFL